MRRLKRPGWLKRRMRMIVLSRIHCQSLSKILYLPQFKT